MTPQELAAQLDLDLAQPNTADPFSDDRDLPEDYGALLHLARRFKDSALDMDPHRLLSLRQRILGVTSLRASTRRSSPSGPDGVLRLFQLKVIVPTALAIGLALILAWPEVASAAAQSLERVIRALNLGPYTSVEQRAPSDGDSHLGQPPLYPMPDPNDIYNISLPIGGYAGNVFPGEDATVQHVGTLTEALSKAGFAYRVPTFVPPGYVFHEAQLVAKYVAVLEYTGPTSSLFFVALKLGTQPSNAPIDYSVAPTQTLIDGSLVSTVVVSTTANSTSQMIVTNGTVASTTVGNTEAIWVNSSSLNWETDGVGYTVGGLDLDLRTATAIALSIR